MSNQDHFCVVCTELVPDYEPVFCCSGFECGCMGKPTEPCLCPACAEKLKSPWVSAKDRLPQDYVSCLLLVGQQYRVAHMETHNEYKHWTQNIRNEWVRYWYPIPDLLDD